MTIAGAGAGAGFGGALAFGPESLFTVGTPGFWADLDSAGAITRNTQPTIPGGGWAGANWVGSGLGGYAHTPGATTNLSNSVLTVGNRYITLSAITGRTAGQVTHKDGATAGTARNANGAYSDELTCTTSTASIWTPDTNFDGTVTITSIANLSVASVTCKGTLGDLAQATAANMPYAKALGSRQGVYFATNDAAVLGVDKSTQRFLHDGTGMTLSFVVNIPSIAVAGLVSSQGGATHTGMRLDLSANGSLSYTAANGSAYVLYAASAAGVIANGVTSLITVRMNTANGVQVWCNGNLVAEDTSLTGVLSAADASYLLVVGNSIATAAGVLGAISDPYAVAKYATDAELALLHRYFAAKHGITLA